MPAISSGSISPSEVAQVARRIGFLRFFAGVPSGGGVGHNKLRSSYSERAFLVSILAVAPLLVWSGIAVSVKRLHDIGISGWWTIPCFVPYVSYIAVIALGLIRGQAGKNAYGEDPHRSKVVTL